MRYGSDHKAATRRRVLEQAAAAIRSDGPDRLGVAGVMRRAGLTHGGFYAHFASRDDLLAGAVAYMLDQRYAEFFAAADTAEPREMLRHFVARYLSMAHRDRRDVGCPLPILSAELHRLPDAARAGFVAAIERLTAVMTTLLTRVGAPDPRPRVLSAIAEMVGAVALARTIGADAAAELLATAQRSVLGKLDLA